MSELTLILQRIDRGDAQAAQQILPLVYDELRKLAAAKMAREAPGLTLQATALVHEAWLRLGGDAQPAWENRGHFFAAAAEAMRRILIDQARRRRAQRHGGGVDFVSASATGFDVATPAGDEDVLLVSDALEGLAAHDSRKAELVKLWYFAGLTLEEIAAALGISPRTADRDLAFAAARGFLSIAAGGRGHAETRNAERRIATRRRSGSPSFRSEVKGFMPERVTRVGLHVPA